MTGAARQVGKAPQPDMAGIDADLLPSLLRVNCVSTLCFLGVKTTGADPSQAQLLEVAFKCFGPDESFQGEWQAWVRQPSAFYLRATCESGRKSIPLAKALDAVDSVARYVRCLVGHNIAACAVPILISEAAKIGHPLARSLETAPVVDTALLALRRNFRQLARWDFYREVLGPRCEADESAYADADACARCYFWMLQHPEPRVGPGGQAGNGGRVYLKTTVEEKDEVKELGGKWDPVRRAWYAPSRECMGLLRRFAEARIFCLAGEDRHFGPPELRIEPLPPSCPVRDVWDHVHPEDRQELFQTVGLRASFACEFCDVSRRTVKREIAMRCSFANGVQKLERLLFVCSHCHEVLKMRPGVPYPPMLLGHFQAVSRLGPSSCQQAMEEAFALYAAREKEAWAADMSVLTGAGVRTIGV